MSQDLRGNHLPLQIDDLRRLRTGARMGSVIHYFESVDSTNTVAHRLAVEGAPEGAVVIAEAQTRGRGRLGRAWVSPPFRNAYVSVVLRPQMPADGAARITLVAGLAVLEAVAEWDPRAAIKWPNDVVIDGRKIAGILTELEADAEGVRFVILGIGVNLNISAEDFPEDLRDRAIGLAAATGGAIDRVLFIDRLLTRLDDCYGRFVRAGFAAIRPLWEAGSCLTGKRVEIVEGRQRHAGVAIGIDNGGALLLRGHGGETIRVVAGDVTVLDGYGTT